MKSVKVAVVAISQKKEKGWLKLATLDGKSWSDMGAHFTKKSLENSSVRMGLVCMKLNSKMWRILERILNMRW